MGLFSKQKPKIKIESTKKDSYSGWVKCTGCLELVHANELTDNLNCCPKCNHHYRLTVKQRLDLLIDKDTFEILFDNIQAKDSLSFVDTQPYSERLESAKSKSGNDEAITVGVGNINNEKVAMGVLDFSFMGGSMGSVVGERITLLIEHAIKNDLPVILVSASGGARMQESILSLMQMAKTSAALTKLHKSKNLYISILTNPTTGGVTASFASLGDIIIAEPDALIAFAGPRVVEQTINQKLPEGAQKSEFLLERGMVDLIVKRKDLKNKVSFFINFFAKENINKKNNVKNNILKLLSSNKENRSKELVDEKN